MPTQQRIKWRGPRDPVTEEPTLSKAYLFSRTGPYVFWSTDLKVTPGALYNVVKYSRHPGRYYAKSVGRARISGWWPTLEAAQDAIEEAHWRAKPPSA